MQSQQNKIEQSDCTDQLLDALLQGQPWAIEQLLDKFEAAVYRFFFYSHRDHDRALDECAETFCTLLSAAQKFRGTSESLPAFIFGIARNVQYRSWRNNSPTVELLDDEIESRNCQSPDQFAVLSLQQEYYNALQLIEQLNDPARQIMLLRYVEELKISEIAAALKLPENTVKSHLRRSCEKLRRQMQDEQVQRTGSKS